MQDDFTHAHAHTHLEQQRRVFVCVFSCTSRVSSSVDFALGGKKKKKRWRRKEMLVVFQPCVRACVCVSRLQPVLQVERFTSEHRQEFHPELPEFPAKLEKSVQRAVFLLVT